MSFWKYCPPPYIRITRGPPPYKFFGSPGDPPCIRHARVGFLHVFGRNVVFTTYLKNYALQPKSHGNLFWRILVGLQFAHFVSSIALLVQELLLDLWYFLVSRGPKSTWWYDMVQGSIPILVRILWKKTWTQKKLL